MSEGIYSSVSVDICESESPRINFKFKELPNIKPFYSLEIGYSNFWLRMTREQAEQLVGLMAQTLDAEAEKAA